MNKYSILIAVLSLFTVGHVLAQTNPDKEEAEKDKQEIVKPEDKVTEQDKPTPAIKVVPAARNKHAKPEKVSSAKPRNERSGGTRPARNVRPSSRPVRPGNGRN